MSGYGVYRELRARPALETSREMEGLRIAPDKASRSAGSAILRYSVGVASLLYSKYTTVARAACQPYGGAVIKRP